MAEHSQEYPVYVEKYPTDCPASPAEDLANASYEVGYKKTLRHTRFKPGQSGNPKGRPKDSRSPDDIKRSIFNETVRVIVDGKERIVTAYEAAVLAVSEKARLENLAAFKEMDGDMKRLAPKEQKPAGLIWIHSECLHDHDDCLEVERAAVEAAKKKSSSA